jgi:HSP20 family protein
MDRRSPFEELERLIERLDEAREATSGLAVDVKDVDGSFEVVADLPGFGNDDIDVEVQDRTVRIDASTETAASEDADHYVRRERTTNAVSRSVTLPDAVEESEASASFSNGVLTVTLPKARAADSSTSIEVE